MLFLHSLLIVSTVINAVRPDFAFVSTPVIESAEKRLVAAELLRFLLSGGASSEWSIAGTGKLPAGISFSQYVDDPRDPEGIDADEKRPNGSGDRGIMGDSTPVRMVGEGRE